MSPVAEAKNNTETADGEAAVMSQYSTQAGNINADVASKNEIILYYKYAHVVDPEGFVKWHKDVCSKLGLKGRVLIAHEGINGTLEGSVEATARYCELLLAQDGSEGTFGDFSTTIFKRSPGTKDGTAFPKLKVKVRTEVVSLALERSAETDVDPNTTTGIHLKPEELKSWYENGEDFIVVDMRNDYEFKVGHFKNSIHPGLRNFRDLAEKVSELDEVKEASRQGKKILNVCTGGIRCEKASGFLIKKGFENIYQLDGGMHTYMEKYPGQDFLGSLYVFDGRETMEFATEKGLPREIVGKCDTCSSTTETFANCANDECHAKILCCVECQNKAKAEHKEKTRSDVAISTSGSFVFCSESCKAHGAGHDKRD